MKGLSPGAALVMLMAGPAVNLASILVVRKSLGRRFTWIYLLTVVGFSILFGLLVNAIGISVPARAGGDACCAAETAPPATFKLICAIILTLLPASNPRRPVRRARRFPSAERRRKVRSRPR